MPRDVIGCQLASGCRFQMEPDGVVRDEDTFLPMSGPSRAGSSSSTSAPATGRIGRDDGMRAAEDRDLVFLTRVFGAA